MTIQVKEKELKLENSIIFDSNSSQWNRQKNYNLMLIKSQENYFNDVLKARGHVFLNEIFDSLGLPRTQAGAVIGWVQNTKDAFIEIKTDILNDEQIKLTFNVDGIIYDLI